MKKYKSLIIKLSILLFFIIIFIVLCVIKNNNELAEYYSTNISSNYIKIVSPIFSLIPFSVYEFTLIFIITMCIFYVVTIIIKLCKKQYMKSLNRTISFILFIAISVDIYFATASISYGRNNVAIPQYEGEVTREYIDEVFEYFLKDYNTISTNFERNEDGTIINPYTFEEVNDLLEEEYKKLDPSYFPEYTPRAKQLLFSDIFTELHFTGIFWGPTGEANINKNVHAAELAHTMAHEFAHAKGVFREDDANLVAMYVTLNSDNEYLRYTAYYANFYSLLRIYQLNDYETYVNNFYRLNENIRKEYQTISDYWWKEHNFLEKLGTWYNDLFLKINGNEEGVLDYQDTSKPEDSGEVNEDNKPIYNNFSTYAKLFFHLYNENHKN